MEVELGFTETAPERALEWHLAGRGAVLATVIETWGSAPRPVGAQMAIAGDGAMAGSVSAGCVEGAVVSAAQEQLQTGGHRVLEFTVSDSDAFAVGLACGGCIRILLEPVGGSLPQDLLERLVSLRGLRQPVSCFVDLISGRGELCLGEAQEPRRAVRDERCAQSVVIRHDPPLRLFVVGAVHIAQSLVPMARMVGYDPMVIDPRTAFATQSRFSNETLVTDWPDEVLQTIGLDERSAVVALTHDPKIDDAALAVALRATCFYIGALGSRKSHAARLKRLSAAGFDAQAQRRVQGPVGLDIGAVTPAEIAVSILAELTATLRGRTGDVL